jgi:hypothetical protein
MKNIIEVNAEEDYVNLQTDDLDAEVKNGLVIEPVDPTPQSEIAGETFIKPKIEEIYSVQLENGEWKVEDGVPVSLRVVDNYSIAVTWKKSTHG